LKPETAQNLIQDQWSFWGAGQTGRLMHLIRRLVLCLTALAAWLAFLGFCSSPAAAGTEGIPFVWQGTITSAQSILAPPRGSGAFTDRWVLRARWKETQRIEVKDSDGSLVGWFVKLEDDGSSWSAATSGTVTVPCMRGGADTRVESAEASGRGDVFTPGWGWIYYSASDKDPLASVLPNGSYAFSSNTTTTQKYTVNWVRHTCPLSDGYVDVTQGTRPAYLHYKVGGLFMFEPFAAPGGFPGKYLPVQAVRAMASQRLHVPAASPWDSQSRQISNDRMQGSSSNRLYNSFSNTLSWDIARVLDIKPIIKKCKESWRPVGEGAAQGSNEISITASVPDQPDAKGKWRFTLMEVSSQKGYCMNAGDDTGLDLEFVRGQEGFGEPKTTSAGGSSITSSSDGGASGGSDSSGASAEKMAPSGSGASGTSSLPQWEKGKAYTKGDAVQNDGAAYTCLTAHTSRATNEPGSGPQWQQYWAEGAGSQGLSSSAGSGGGSSAGSGGTASSGGDSGEAGGQEEIEGTETTNEVTVRIKSKDYGAWAKLKAEINVDGVWYQAQSEDGKDYITIPLDQNENHISDWWEKQNNVFGQAANSDQDERPEGVGREPGDGFSNYEEYRGFMINGQWEDTKPYYKDVFIRDEIGLGIGWFGDLLLAVHLLDAGEMDKNNMVSVNRGYAKVQGQDGQKGIRLVQRDLEPGTAGEVFPKVGCPNAVKEVVVDAFDDPEHTEAQERKAYAEGLFTYSNFHLATTIAHELGHAVNIVHHGEVWAEVDSGLQVAYPGGIWSGDVTCIMLYAPPKHYSHGGGTKWTYPQGELIERNHFCDSPAGTGVNTPGPPDSQGRPRPVAGDAQKGACRKQVTLKGWHQDGN
jgi:hypothetical protein